MVKKSKVMVRIEYERDWVRRAVYGEIDEAKLDGVHAGDESFICLLNDGKTMWVDKESILSVYELETKLIAYEKRGIEEASFAIEQGLKIRS